VARILPVKRDTAVGMEVLGCKKCDGSLKRKFLPRTVSEIRIPDGSWTS